VAAVFLPLLLGIYNRIDDPPADELEILGSDDDALDSACGSGSGDIFEVAEAISPTVTQGRSVHVRKIC